MQLTALDLVNSVAGSTRTSKRNTSDYSAFVKCYTPAAALDILSGVNDRNYVDIIRSYITPCSISVIVVLRGGTLGVCEAAHGLQ